MIIRVTTIFYFIVCVHVLNAQAQDAGQHILSINARIDQAVVTKDLLFLQQHYADDFVFTHGTGYVEGKDSWLKNVASVDTRFLSRIQDSTTVELHGDVALVAGKINIQRQDNNRIVAYGIWYIRIYRLTGTTWQMISHRTTREWHD